MFGIGIGLLGEHYGDGMLVTLAGQLMFLCEVPIYLWPKFFRVAYKQQQRLCSMQKIRAELMTYASVL